MDTITQISAQPSRVRTIVFWITTAIVIIGMLIGGALQLTHYPLQTSILTGLGYPPYLLNIIGACKILGAITLLLSRNTALKTAAYAGLFFIVITATVSHVAHGDFISAINPFVVAVITLISYRLNPKLTSAATPVSSNRAKRIAWWSAIIVLEFVLLSGGIGELFHLWGTVQGTVNQLGYPLYFLSIIGVWKIAGGIALLFPGFPRLQLWAYIGIFFDFTGAAASSLSVGSSPFHVITPLLFAGLTITAWMLQRYRFSPLATTSNGLPFQLYKWPAQRPYHCQRSLPNEWRRPE